MRNSFVTPDGLTILANSLTNDGDQQYWIGYYALAYVPEDSDARKSGRSTDPDKIAEYTSQTTIVPYKDGRPYGDIIYNVFQGSMADTVASFSEGSTEAGKLYRQCLYAENIESTYRYVLTSADDGTKFNTLVAFEQKDDDPSMYKRKYTYIGVNGTTSSEIPTTEEQVKGGLPLPASLYYNGGVSGGQNEPLVSADMRLYYAKADTWNNSNSGTRDFPYVNEDNDPGYAIDPMTSISNFNRYHAPSTSEGYVTSYEPACRNMAKATKLFPIEHYQVVKTKLNNDVLVNDVEMGSSSTNIGIGMDSKDAGTRVGAIKYKIHIDLRKYLKQQAKQINNPDAPPTSFKFNRIGIYAVPVTLHAFNTESPDIERCGGKKLQIQINGDAEPTLFAIIDIDTTEMSETSLADLTQDFTVNFNPDTQIVDDTAIYYNLYEDDSITWYKNQLIANASISEAVTTLTTEVGYLRNLVESMGNGGGSGSSYCGNAFSITNFDLYAYKNHTHPVVSNVVVIKEPLELSADNTSIPRENNPLSVKYLEKIDEIFSIGLVPVIAYHLSDDTHSPSYRGPVTHYAYLCGVGFCAYMFYDAGLDLNKQSSVTSRRGIFIRIRTANGPSGNPDKPILAVHYDKGNPGYGEDASDA